MKKKASLTRYVLLLLAFVASAVTGIGLHVAVHGAGHEVWHNWAVAHVLSSLCWLISVAIHIKRHRAWYRAIASKGIGHKSRPTILLSAIFLFVVVTGLILLAGVNGASSALGRWHYILGLVLIAFSLIHIFSRRRTLQNLLHLLILLN